MLESLRHRYEYTETLYTRGGVPRNIAMGKASLFHLSQKHNLADIKVRGHGHTWEDAVTVIRDAIRNDTTLRV